MDAGELRVRVLHQDVHDDGRATQTYPTGTDGQANGGKLTGWLSTKSASSKRFACCNLPINVGLHLSVHFLYNIVRNYHLMQTFLQEEII